MNKYQSRAKSNIALATVCAVVLILCGAMDILYFNLHIYTAICEIVFALLIFAVTLYRENTRIKNADKLLRELMDDDEIEEYDMLNSAPLPVVATRTDGSIKWYNKSFSALFNDEQMHDCTLEAIIPEIKWSEILRFGKGTSANIKINGRIYEVASRLVREKAKGKGSEHIIYCYILDKTEQIEAIEAQNNHQTDVAVICVDNYDEIFQRMSDAAQQQVSSALRNIINGWANESTGVIKKIDRDRYYLFFEHKDLKNYIDNKFDILEKVRAAGEAVKQQVSVSIGIGTGDDISNNEQAARTALEMAQGRGGDQVGLKDNNQYKFYGGKNREYEKSTRVKTRAVASALTDYIKNSDKVIFVGHKNADYDCFGAAMGLQRAVREFGKTPYILYDRQYLAVKKLYDELIKNPEYENMFITSDEAPEFLTKDTLVVVLDTHRPSMLQSQRLVEAASKVVLIDHHRRSTEFINNCSLIYHEPYASSTCEMVTEILQYMSIGSAVTATEAECLYTGILLDTKNFIVKTGVRTFEAASYLRRLGLNTVNVKKLFNVDKDEYDRRAEIVHTAVEVAPNYSIAYTEHSWPNIRVIASQAADEMLNINSVCASFVVYVDEGKTCVSARSVNDVNVHVIMEALGGGGHATVAGVQRSDVTVQQMIELLKEEINNYIKTK